MLKIMLANENKLLDKIVKLNNNTPQSTPTTLPSGEIVMDGAI